MDTLLALAARVGLTVLPDAPAPHIYDGQVLRTGPDPAGAVGPMCAEVVCHELAHWLCATDAERALPEWGLGRERSYGASAPERAAEADDDPQVIEDAVRWVSERVALAVGLDRAEFADWWAQMIAAGAAALQRDAAGEAGPSDRAVCGRISLALSRAPWLA